MPTDRHMRAFDAISGWLLDNDITVRWDAALLRWRFKWWDGGECVLPLQLTESEAVVWESCTPRQPYPSFVYLVLEACRSVRRLMRG